MLASGGRRAGYRLRRPKGKIGLAVWRTRIRWEQSRACRGGAWLLVTFVGTCGQTTEITAGPRALACSRWAGGGREVAWSVRYHSVGVYRCPMLGEAGR